MTLAYLGSPGDFLATAYGVMVGAKLALLGGLLSLGGMNYLLVERLRTDPATPVTRLKRFAEVEIGIGVAVLFAASSLTSVPPARDLAAADRVPLGEIAERMLPDWPSFTSPGHADLAIPLLQATLDAKAATAGNPPPAAFEPGAGVLQPRNAEDIGWSEYNHHAAGAIVTAIGLLALLGQAGLRWARHWPLLFLGLAAFLFLRSDPEAWPLGSIGFWASMRDSEVLQHRLIIVLTAVFALFEWGVRSGAIKSSRAALVFPLLTAVGGTLLLTHSHQIADVKDQLLIELSHTPMAILAIGSGWSRWLELRLDAPGNRIAGWLWPIGFVLIGIILMLYRES
jgi:putative copper resistance protein D